VIDHHVDRRDGDTLGEPGDAAFLDREVVRQDLDAHPCQRRKRRRALRRTRDKDPVLHEENRYLMSVVGEPSSEVVVIAYIVRLEWIA